MLADNTAVGGDLRFLNHKIHKLLLLPSQSTTI